MRPELTMLHVHGTGIGYGRLGVKLSEALVAQGVTVYDDLGPMPEQVGNPSLEIPGETHAKTNVVCWVATPTHARWWYEGQYAAVFTMWEATQLPEGFRETIHEFDQIIVPSLQNVELFSQYHPNVSYVPLGIDPVEWHYVPRREPSPFFNFLISGAGKRKGTDLAFKAFETVFGSLYNDEGQWTGNGAIPRLVMKSIKSEDWYAPWVDHVTGRLTDENEQALYETAHCYLQPSRGEGFGLQPLQAMAQGIPTILTDAHGHEAFASLGIPLSWETTKAEYFIYGDAGEWWEPDFETLCERMWDVYKNYDVHKTHAEIAAQLVAKKWTWAETARKFALHLGDQLATPYRGDGTHHIPDAKLYLTRVLRPWKADIAGTIYPFSPGKDYYQPSDVKRILFEAGILDPSCLDGYQLGDGAGQFDTGLSEAQLTKVDHYRAEHAHCPTCGQRVNSSPTKADEIFAEMTR